MKIYQINAGSGGMSITPVLVEAESLAKALIIAGTKLKDEEGITCVTVVEIGELRR